MYRTIPRNHKTKVAAIKAKVQSCRVYSLENNFEGRPVTNLEWVWEQYLNHDHGQLKDRGDDGYTIAVHGNLWYELS